MNTKTKIAKKFSVADEKKSIIDGPIVMKIVNGKLIREYN